MMGIFNRTYEISLFPRGARTNDLPQQVHETWEALKKRFTTHTPWARDKVDSPAFSPTVYAPGTTRAKVNVRAVTLAVLDIDGVDDSALARTLAPLEQHTLAYYTTYSHGSPSKTGTCARVVLPLSRPVPAKDWPATWARLNTWVGGTLDPSTKDPSRLYFLPYIPPSTTGTSYAQEGALLDPDTLPHVTGITAAAPQAIAAPFTTHDVRALANRLKIKQPEVCDRLKKMLSGDVWAHSGERDTWAFQLSAVLAERFPSADPMRLAALFAPSLAVMHAEKGDAPTVADIASKIARKQADARQRNAEKAALRADTEKARIKEAFAPLTPGRDTPYTPDEIETHHSKAGLTPVEFARRWVVQKGRSYYLYVAGDYRGPYEENAVANAAYRDLAPAREHGVYTLKTNNRGELVPKSPQELVKDYGTVASSIVVHMGLPQSYYTPDTGAFVEAVCRPRALEPVYNDKIAEWLKLMGGAAHEKLLDWLHFTARLEDPCAAIYLQGVRRTGKSLFAHGVSRLWTAEGPSTLDHALSAFNDTLLKCPLVFADECMPEEFVRRGTTGALREFIQARTRPLTRKFQPVATMHGSARLVLAANNMDMIPTSENLTNADIEALAERILFIPVSSEARDYLDYMPKHEPKKWVAEDLFAKHIVWLQRNRKAEPHGRFLVAGSDSALTRKLVTGSGIRSAVCQWLVSYLKSPLRMDRNPELLVRVYGGELLVSVQGLTAHWDMYVTNTRAPTTRVVAGALEGLSSGVRRTVGDTMYFRIDDRNLIAWAHDHGIADEATVCKLLQKADTPAAIATVTNLTGAT